MTEDQNLSSTEEHDHGHGHGHDHDHQTSHNEQMLQTTTQAINVYLASQNKDDGTIGGIGYWQIANGYTAMTLHDVWSGTTGFADLIQDAFAAIASSNTTRSGGSGSGSGRGSFIKNEFNDDSMWWAIANLELFKLTNDTIYLQSAYDIWSYVKQFRLSKGQVIFKGMDMEGAVHWTSKENATQLNTITTGLFAELSARLAPYYCNQSTTTTTGNKGNNNMIELAQGSLAWIRQCRFDQNRYVVLDTIDYGTGEEIDWTFTYTTGQAIAASIAIYEALLETGSGGEGAGAGAGDDFLVFACDLALSAMHNCPAWVDTDGTLAANEYPGQNTSVWDNNDAVGFKSILLRSLTKLLLLITTTGKATTTTASSTRRDSSLQALLQAFIQQQFDSLTTRDTNGQSQYGPYWAGPFQAPTSHSQLAALDAMAAVHAC